MRFCFFPFIFTSKINGLLSLDFLLISGLILRVKGVDVYAGREGQAKRIL